MILIGKPTNKDDYICVKSKTSVILHQMGFIPQYREINNDNIYYLKTEELEKIVKEVEMIEI